MSKTGSTKNKILNQLLDGNKTLSDLSRILGLAPSTVSQHLKELSDMGAIREVQSDHIRKWKYYELNPDFNYEGSPIGGGIVASKIQRRVFYYVIGIGITVGLVYLVLSGTLGMRAPTPANSSGIIAGTPGGTGGTYVPIRLTDPPNVPNGTQVLVISYSGISLHTAKGWISTNSSGSVDLMSLINTSQIIAGASLPNDSEVDEVAFNITSATIQINDTQYNVTVPSGNINARISGNASVNSSSGILVDLFPTVVTEFTSNSTLFVMVPAVKAVLVPKGNLTETASFKTGERTRLSTAEEQQLKGANEQIVLSNPYLSSTNDSMDISVTVSNEGTNAVVLKNLLVIGNMTPVIAYNGTCSANNKSISLWCRINRSGNGSNVKISGNNVPQVQASLPAIDIQQITGVLRTGGKRGKATTNLTVSVPVGPQIPIPLVNKTTASANASVWINASSVGAVGVIGASNNSAQTVNISSSISISGWSGHAKLIKFKVGHSGKKAKQTADFAVKVGSDSDENAVLGSVGNITLNNSALFSLIVPAVKGSTAQVNASVMAYENIDASIVSRRSLEFSANANGTLSFQSPPEEFKGTGGFTLQPGESETFTFNGTPMFPSGLTIALSPGSSYRIVMVGSYNSGASLNVTAS